MPCVYRAIMPALGSTLSVLPQAQAQTVSVRIAGWNMESVVSSHAFLRNQLAANHW